MFSQLFMLHAYNIHVCFVCKRCGNDDAYLARAIQYALRIALHKTKQRSLFNKAVEKSESDKNKILFNSTIKIKWRNDLSIIHT